MKIFDLVCANDHRFEGWFGSGAEFDQQREGGLIACPLCGDNQIIKVPSASYVNTGAPHRTDRNDTPQATTDQAQYANMHAALLAKVVEYVMKNTEDVGTAFPEEARKIHYGESPERKIRGTASADDVSGLRDEGIDVVPLPIALPAGKSH